MSWFPWHQANVMPPIPFVCKHCGAEMPTEGGKVIICTCDKSVEEHRVEKQRQLNFIRDREAAINSRRR